MIFIRLASKNDIQNYTDLLQQTYESAYADEKIGLPQSLFSKEIFCSTHSQDYLRSNLDVSDKQKTWLAFDGEKMVGSITITDKGDDCELRGFYILPKYQGQGIGKKLWKKALVFAKGKDITCDIYAHNHKTIEIYKKWGFEIDTERGEFYRHWPEWPEGVQAKSIYMRFKR